MFSNNKLRKDITVLEARIDELEEKLKEKLRVEFYSFGGSMPRITAAKDLRVDEPVFMRRHTKYSVSCEYIIGEIISHLGLVVNFQPGTHPGITLEKPRRVKK